MIYRGVPLEKESQISKDSEDYKKYAPKLGLE